MRILLLCCILLLTGVAAQAAPVDPALQKELLALYDEFNATVAKGQYDKAVAQRSAASQKMFRQQIKSAQDRKAFVEMNQAITPDSLDVVHGKLSKDGNRASLIAHASKIVPAGLKDKSAPPPGTVLTSELTLQFVREGGKWKYDAQTLGPDPTKVSRCEDVKFEPIEAYDAGASTSAGGPIARVEFNPDHTLLVFRVLDEENCAFLPSRDTLAKGGFDVSLLQPYAVVSLGGLRHKTSPRKIWVEQLEMMDDD
ncbi:MAG: hypothetical protein AB7R90_18540 [Reyranellaceae bacterium]